MAGKKSKRAARSNKTEGKRVVHAYNDRMYNSKRALALAAIAVVLVAVYCCKKPQL